MSGRYRVIVADPAWQYRNDGQTGAAALQYATLSTDAICALPVRDLAAPSAVLYLWGTWPLLPDAMRVMAAWGFRHMSGFPWIKLDEAPTLDLWGHLRLRPNYGTGFWVRGCSEFVLIGVRGQVRNPQSDLVGLLSENFGHSRKPDNIYEIAEQTPGPYLELFGRRRRDRWDAWGNEVPDSIEIPLPQIVLDEMAAARAARTPRPDPNQPSLLEAAL